MKRLDQLRARLAKIDRQINAILAHNDLTDEQRALHDALVARRDRTAAEIDTLEKEEAAKATAAATREARIVVSDRRLTSADQPAPRGTEFRIPANVRRVSVRNFRGTRDGRTAEERAYRFGQFMLSELARQMPGRFQFPEATNWVQRNLAAVTTKDASGYHNLVPHEFGLDLIDLREVYGVVRRLFRNVPMTSDTRTDPRRQGGLTAYFVAEGAAGTESNKTWDNVGLTAKELMCLARYTANLNADAVISVGDDLAGEIAYAFAEKEDQCGFNGDGTSTYGRIHGVRARLQDVDLAGTDSAGLVTGAGNAYSELTAANFQAVIGKLPQYADTPNAVWVVHRSFYYTVMEPLITAAGGTTARELREGQRAPRPIAWGYPVEFSQVMPSTEANSQVCALLGDFALGAAFGDRQQDQIAFSEHATVNGENVFERNQVAIRGTERFDINVHDVGSSSAAGPIVGLQTAAA